MIVLLAIAGWSIAALAIGLITGDHFLRTGSVLVLCLSVGGAFLLDRMTPRGGLWLEESEWGDEVGAASFDWYHEDAA